jgi:hypothetical protein
MFFRRAGHGRRFMNHGTYAKTQPGSQRIDPKTLGVIKFAKEAVSFKTSLSQPNE